MKVVRTFFSRAAAHAAVLLHVGVIRDCSILCCLRLLSGRFPTLKQTFQTAKSSSQERKIDEQRLVETEQLRQLDGP